MADQETPGMPGDQDGNLETVDLNMSKSTEHSEGSAKPKLQFQGDIPPASSDPAGSKVDGSGGSAPESPIEGTELRSRPRTRSGGTTFKEWSVHQIKVTKQLVSERFGRGLRTVDTELETRIESLRETQRKYAQLMSLMQQFTSTFVHVLDTQKSLAEHFAFMSVRAPELHTEFHYNSETQKVIARNGDTLLAAARFFVSNMHTICTKTMEDTLQTVKTYETARLSYDAYRTELEELREKSQSSQKAAAQLPGMAAEFEKHKSKFEQLRHDVDVKLKLLDENKLKVSHQQLIMLQGAFAAYFAGNHQAVDALLKEFKSKLEAGDRSQDPPEWLENMRGHSASPAHDGQH